MFCNQNIVKNCLALPETYILESTCNSKICDFIWSWFQMSVEYSFILGIPVIMAGALSELMDAGAEDAVAAVSPVPIIVGMVVAGITGYFAIILIKWLMKSDRFTIFSIYTLILGLAVLAQHGVLGIRVPTGNMVTVCFQHSPSP